MCIRDSVCHARRCEVGKRMYKMCYSLMIWTFAKNTLGLTSDLFCSSGFALMRTSSAIFSIPSSMLVFSLNFPSARSLSVGILSTIFYHHPHFYLSAKAHLKGKLSQELRNVVNRHTCRRYTQLLPYACRWGYIWATAAHPPCTRPAAPPAAGFRTLEINPQVLRSCKVDPRFFCMNCSMSCAVMSYCKSPCKASIKFASVRPLCSTFNFIVNAISSMSTHLLGSLQLKTVSVRMAREALSMVSKPFSRATWATFFEH
eukprot:TRINITY_DN11520_c0_g2_i2.p1 TRINITY_DN11520_c0_g2~~TRINITY_DN11520_c0_g2_i2.p1  ORF type:complete len:258 (-),score=-21.07 TRINITY_DN11520_c0_g2_i2:184-957(-)